MRAPAAAILCLLAALAVAAQIRATPRPPDGRVGVPAFVLLLLIPVLVCGVQVVPLPRALVALLSPGVHAIHASITDVRLEAAQTSVTLGLAPQEAALSAGRWTAAALVGFAAWLSVRRDPESQAAIRATEVALGLTLLVVMFQALTDLDLIYLYWPAAGRGISIVQGPLVNSNHLGALLLLMVPVTLARALDAASPERRAAWTAIAVAAALVAVATFSRAVLLALPVGVGLVLWGERQELRRSSKAQLFGALLALAVAMGAIVVIVNSASGGKLWLLVQPDLLFEFSGRSSLYATAGRILADYPAFGIGPGAFVDLHFQYADAPQRFSVLTAHSVYFQLLIDFGVLAGSVMLLGLLVRFAMVCRGGFGPDGFTTVERGVFVGGFTLLAQNVAGFSLLVPGVAVPAVALAGALDANYCPPPRLRVKRRLLGIGGVGLLGLVVAGAGWNQLEGRKATDLALAAVLAERPVDDERLGEALQMAARYPADPWGWQTIGVALLPARPDRALPLLNSSMRLDPHGPAPHWAAADALRILGARSQAVIEYRLALERAGPDFDRITDEVVAAYEQPAVRCSAAPRDHAARRQYALALTTRRADLCASELVQALYVADPEDLEIAATRASLLLRTGKMEAAESAAQDLVGTVRSLDGHTLLARIAEQTGRIDQAEVHWRAALAGAKGDRRLLPLGEVGRLLTSTGRSEDLRRLAAAERAGSRLSRPMLARCLYLESCAAELDGQLGDALQLARRAEAIDSEVTAYQRAVERLRSLE